MVLQYYTKNCVAINHTINFTTLRRNIQLIKVFKRLIKTLFFIYANFKCNLIPSTDDRDFGRDNKNN